jgi:mycothiol synthase
MLRTVSTGGGMAGCRGTGRNGETEAYIPRVVFTKATPFADNVKENHSEEPLMSESCTIRPFAETDDDYAAWAAVKNAAYPEYATTVERLRSDDARHDPKYRRGRWLAFQGDTVVGSAHYGQSPWSYHPRKFHIKADVIPEARRRGVGSALYDTVLAALAPFDPVSLHTDASEAWAESVRFAEKRGFVEQEREWESRLNVNAFDPMPFAPLRDKPLENGIAIHHLAELRETDPDWEAKLYDAEASTFSDIPSEEPLSTPPLEVYRQKVLENPNLLPEAFLIAVDTATGQYVGLSSLWKSPPLDHLDTGFTAVRRAYRGRGIAFGLKLRVIDYAKARGVAEIRTENSTKNRPMLSINEALGFEKQPAWVYFVKRLHPAEA